MAGQQRGPRPASQRGDFTGNKKEQLATEHAEAVDARREELGIVTGRQNAIREQGVVDLTGDEPVLEHPDLDPEDATELDVVKDASTGKLDVQPKPTPAPAGGTRIGSSNADEVYELPDERVTANGREVLTVKNQDTPTLIQVHYDLPQTTIGYKKEYDFKAGARYRVPRHVASHLEEKGLCSVLSLTTA